MCFFRTEANRRAQREGGEKMIGDQVIDAVIDMQTGRWRDEQVADEIIRLFPDAAKGMSRADVVSRVTDRAERRVSLEAERAILKFIREDHPEVWEFME